MEPEPNKLGNNWILTVILVQVKKVILMTTKIMTSPTTTTITIIKTTTMITTTTITTIIITINTAKMTTVIIKNFKGKMVLGLRGQISSTGKKQEVEQNTLQTTKRLLISLTILQLGTSDHHIRSSIIKQIKRIKQILTFLRIKG